MHPALEVYKILLEELEQGAITAQTFEKKFLQLYKDDPTEWDDDEFEILQSLFYSVDAFCENESLRTEGDIDEEDLRRASSRVLDKINRIKAIG